MERKPLSLEYKDSKNERGKAKKRLRYFQAEQSSPCRLKVKEVVSLQDIDNFFDELDSQGPGTPLLSPLPNPTMLPEDEDEEPSRQLKLSPSFALEESEDLVPIRDSHENLLIDKVLEPGSPLEDIAPIKTSSPIELNTEKGGERNEERPDSTSLLHEVEDEDLINGGLSKPSSKQRDETPEEVLQVDSGSPFSPVLRLEFGNTPQKNAFSEERLVPLLSSPTPTQESETSASETREESLAVSSSGLIPNRQPEPLPLKKAKVQPSKVKLDAEVKESSFQQKLMNALKPKTLWNQEARKQQSRLPSPQELNDEFFILEDEAPIRFTIPRKTEAVSREKNTQEGGSSKLEKPPQDESASLKLREEAEKDKGKTGAAKRKSQPKRKDTVPQPAVEVTVEPSRETEDVGEQISVTPEISLETVQLVTGRQKRKGRTAKSVHISSKEAKADVQSQKPVGKKTGKLTTGREVPPSNEKGKRSKAKATSRVAEMEAVGSTKLKKTAKDKGDFMNNQVAEEQEQEQRVNYGPEPQPEQQSITTAVKKANKQASVKQSVKRKPLKGKKAEITKENTKTLPSPGPGISAEDAGTGRRKRGPPGEWWLVTQTGDNTQEQVDSVQTPKRAKRTEAAKIQTKKVKESVSLPLHESQSMQSEIVSAPKMPTKLKKPQPDSSTSNRKDRKATGGRRKLKVATPNRGRDQETVTDAGVGGQVEGQESAGRVSLVAASPPPLQRSLTPGHKGVFNKVYTRDSQHCPPTAYHQQESVQEKRQRKPTSNWWEVPPSQGTSCATLDKPVGVVSSQQTGRSPLKKRKLHMVNTPKTVKRSLATYNALLTDSATVSALGRRRQGRRNLLHSLEDQSEQSSENVHADHRQANSHLTFDVDSSGTSGEPSGARKQTAARISTGSNQASEYDFGFRSGPSSMIELERFEENEDSDLPSTRITPRVLSDCKLCCPPLRPIVLETEDWDNLSLWFTYLWPPASKNGQVISPDDFHWHAHNGRAMGHMVDLQSKTFSSGKILLGSFMKKPPHMDQNTITVFNLLSSCVRVEMGGVKTVYNPGQAFIVPRGKCYSIYNICREPAVLLYNRMLSGHTKR